jgi:hypothetical protein
VGALNNDTEMEAGAESIKTKAERERRENEVEREGDRSRNSCAFRAETELLERERVEGAFRGRAMISGILARSLSHEKGSRYLVIIADSRGSIL